MHVNVHTLANSSTSGSDHNSVLPLVHGLHTVTSLFAIALLFDNVDKQQGISTTSTGTVTMAGDTNTQVNVFL